MDRPCALGVLASGRGTNLEAIARAVERGYIKGAEIAVVICDRENAGALRVAERHRLPSVLAKPGGATATREGYDRQLVGTLEGHGVDPAHGLVVLAGFMRILSPHFVNTFKDRVLNIHPALLPSFPGLKAQEQALDHGVKITGCTVHFVTPEVDAGPIIAQRAVTVREDDTAETLAARILRQEHLLYPLAIKLFVEGRLSFVGPRVVIRT